MSSPREWLPEMGLVVGLVLIAAATFPLSWKLGCAAVGVYIALVSLKLMGVRL